MSAIHTCLVVMSMLGVHGTSERFDTCVELVHEARAAGLPDHVVLGVAWVESRFNPEAESGAGAIGPLQIIPRWHCKGPCDPLRVGVRLLVRLRLKYGTWIKSWCHYSQGNRCRESGMRYADKVQRATGWMRMIVLTFGQYVDDGLRPPRWM
jgi:hypothetical protein